MKKNKIISIIKEEVASVFENKIEIKKANNQDIKIILKICDKTIKVPGVEKACSDNPVDRIVGVGDLEKSIKLTLNGKVIGYYVFSDKQSVFDFIKEANSKHLVNFQIENEKLKEKIKDKRGVEGVSIGLLKEYRGKGYGKILLDYPKKMGYDYIWGVQTEVFSNIGLWKKRREVLATGNNGLYITVERF